MLGAKWKTVRAEEKKNLIRRYTMLRKKLICKWLQRKKLKLRQWGCRKMNKSRGLWWNCLNNTCNSNKRKKKMARRTSYIYLPFDHSSYLGGYWCLLKKCSQEREGPSKPKHHIPAYFLFTNDRRAALAAENKNFLEVIACHPCLWIVILEFINHDWRTHIKGSLFKFRFQKSHPKSGKTWQKNKKDHMKRYASLVYQLSLSHLDA